jgi:hypothetical protein
MAKSAALKDTITLANCPKCQASHTFAFSWDREYATVLGSGAGVEQVQVERVLRCPVTAVDFVATVTFWAAR